MARGAASSILLMLSFLLFVASISTSTVSGDTDIIRLPTDTRGLADARHAAAAADDKEAAGDDDDKKRPWKCCNLPLCTRSQPPVCRCMDQVKKCHSKCQYCQELEVSGHKRYICLDTYYGYPGPTCEEEQHTTATAEVVANDKKATANSDDEKRPWECCDLALCTKSQPPICRCMDKVKRCHKNCQYCQELEQSGHKRYICLDPYHGDPGPSCEEEKHAAVAAVADDKKAIAGNDDDEKRPWECCNRSLCAMSWPPICRCMDKVKQCHKNCQHCQESEEDSGHKRYICLDLYRGNPGPRCEED